MPSLCTSDQLDKLSIVFFIIAGVWLFIALAYSCMVLFFLNLRSNGQLGSMNDEGFGRIYLCGSTRYYIPLGWVFRMYIRHLQYDDEGVPTGHANQRQPHFMTRSERRAAMERLLVENSKERLKESVLSKETPDNSNSTTSSPQSRAQHDTGKESSAGKEADLEQGVVGSKFSTVEESTPTQEDDNFSIASDSPICSICLGDYTAHPATCASNNVSSTDADKVPQDPSLTAVYYSATCVHHFHQGCILDWLQRQANNECPCCRAEMVSEQKVWKMVKKIRKEKARKRRHEIAKTEGVVEKRNDISNHSGTGESNSQEDQDEEIFYTQNEIHRGALHHRGQALHNYDDEDLSETEDFYDDSDTNDGDENPTTIVETTLSSDQAGVNQIEEV